VTIAHRPRAALVRREGLAGVLLALSTWSTTGCYVHRATPGVTAPGTTLVVVLNDRGRAELAQSVGPNVDRLEGRVLAVTDSTVALSMRSSRTFAGDEARWTGERLEVRTSGARGFQQRALSRGRTFALVGAAVIGFVALVATRTLNVFGGPERDPGGGNPPQES